MENWTVQRCRPSWTLATVAFQSIAALTGSITASEVSLLLIEVSWQQMWCNLMMMMIELQVPAQPAADGLHNGSLEALRY